MTDYGEPSCYDEAMSSADKLKWEQDMQSEMDSLVQNDTWELTPLPKGKKALPLASGFTRLSCLPWMQSLSTRQDLSLRDSRYRKALILMRSSPQW